MILANMDQQMDLIKRMFPPLLDENGKASDFVSSVVSSTADATGNTTPREIVQMLNSIKDVQLEHLHRGGAEPRDQYLMDQTTFDEALKKVARTRLNQTIYAEYPEQMPFIKALEMNKKGRRGQYFISDLKRIWQMDDEQEALKKADELARIGVFDRRLSNSGLKTYGLPKIYRLALNMLEQQGSSAEA
jgi:hypothetical protein